MGQHKPVHVMNLISMGSIETRILKLIGFKKSVFNGVLDGGEDQVLMKESTFSKFMKSVDVMVTKTDDDRKETPASKGLNKLIETDKETGKTHLKIPIKDKETVVNAIRAFANLLEG